MAKALILNHIVSIAYLLQPIGSQQIEIFLQAGHPKGLEVTSKALGKGQAYLWGRLVLYCSVQGSIQDLVMMQTPPPQNSASKGKMRV